MPSHLAELAFQRGLIKQRDEVEATTWRGLMARLHPAQARDLIQQAQQRDALTLRLLTEEGLISPEEASSLNPFTAAEPDRPSILAQACALRPIPPDALASLLGRALSLATTPPPLAPANSDFQSSATMHDGPALDPADNAATLMTPPPAYHPEDHSATLMTPPPANAAQDFQGGATLIDPSIADSARLAASQRAQGSQVLQPGSDFQADATLIDPSIAGSARLAASQRAQGSQVLPAGEALQNDQTLIDPSIAGSALLSAGLTGSARDGSNPALSGSASGFGSAPGFVSHQNTGSGLGSSQFNSSVPSNLPMPPGTSQFGSSASQGASGSRGHESSILQNVEELIGRKVGRWKVEKLLGKGAMGAVYRARDEGGTPAAMKVILPGLKNALDYIPRFRQEAEVVQRLDHPNIVNFLDYAEDPFPYLVLEFIEGDDLANVLKKKRRLPVEEVVLLVRSVLQAIDYAHKRNIIHRDLKPENILLDAAGNPKISDYGLGRDTTEESEVRLTLTGRAMGTPYYMPPEQIDDAKNADALSDLYAIGAMMFRLISGQPPFTGTQAEILTAHYQKPPPRVRAWIPKAPASLENLIIKLMAKDPKERPQTAREVCNVLDKIEQELSAEASQTSIGQRLKLDIGDLVSDWKLESVLGSGGMGKVFKGRRGEQVSAIKVLAPTVAADATARQRFEREIDVTRKLEHPNIIKVFDSGVAQVEDIQYPYMAMEFIPHDLAKRLEEQGPLEPAEAVAVAIGAGKALSYSASQGVVHRDVKPENILLAEPLIKPEVIRVTDFGVATFTNQASHLTQTTAAVGSPYYMAPEQAKGSDSTDHRADIYALGATLYHLVTGRRLFTADNIQGLLIAHARELPQRADEVLNKVPEDLAWLIDYAVLKQVDDRPANMDEFVTDLESWYEGKLTKDRLAVIKKRVRNGRRPFEGGGSWAPYVIAAIIFLGLIIAAAIAFRPAALERIPFESTLQAWTESENSFKAASKDPTQKAIDAALSNLDRVSTRLASEREELQLPAPSEVEDNLPKRREVLHGLSMSRLEQALTKARERIPAKLEAAGKLEATIREVGLEQKALSPELERLSELTSKTRWKDRFAPRLALCFADIEAWAAALPIAESLSAGRARSEAQNFDEAEAMQKAITPTIDGFKFKLADAPHPLNAALRSELDALRNGISQGRIQLESALSALETRKTEVLDQIREGKLGGADYKSLMADILNFNLPSGNAALLPRLKALRTSRDPREETFESGMRELKAQRDQGSTNFSAMIKRLDDLIRLTGDAVDTSPAQAMLSELSEARDKAAEALFVEREKSTRQLLNDPRGRLKPEDFTKLLSETRAFPGARAELSGWEQTEAGKTRISELAREVLAAKDRYGSILVGRAREAFRQGAPIAATQTQVLSWLENAIEQPIRLADDAFGPLSGETGDDARWLLAEADFLRGIHKSMLLVEPGSEPVSIGFDQPLFAHSPTHKVSLAPYFIDLNELSVREYERFLAHIARLVSPAARAEREPPDWAQQRAEAKKTSDLPARSLNYEDVSAFARWAGKRVPTESEWEFAARRGERPYAWGSQNPVGLAHFAASGPVGASALEGKTPDGIRHMTGNLAEWTSSPFAPYPGGDADLFRRLGGEGRLVIRGGSYLSVLPELKAWLRTDLDPRTRAPDLGARFVAKP